MQNTASSFSLRCFCADWGQEESGRTSSTRTELPKTELNSADGGHVCIFSFIDD